MSHTDLLLFDFYDGLCPCLGAYVGLSHQYAQPSLISSVPAITQIYHQTSLSHLQHVPGLGFSFTLFLLWEKFFITPYDINTRLVKFLQGQVLKAQFLLTLAHLLNYISQDPFPYTQCVNWLFGVKAELNQCMQLEKDREDRVQVEFHSSVGRADNATFNFSAAEGWCCQFKQEVRSTQDFWQEDSYFFCTCSIFRREKGASFAKMYSFFLFF